MTDTITKLVDKTTELSLINKYKDSLYYQATRYIAKQEATIIEYNQLKVTYADLVNTNKAVEKKYQEEVVIVNEKLKLEKKKKVGTWLTFGGITLGVGLGAFLVGYFVNK